MKTNAHIVSTALAAAFAIIACTAGPVSAETHIVEMQGLEFVPDVLDVKVGDTITWVNADVMAHTASADDGAWDSGSMEQGDEWSVTIDVAGAIDYLCDFHPSMTGTINAE